MPTAICLSLILGLGGIWHLNELAEPVEIILSPPGRSTTNLCYGGRDLRQLFITESVSGSLLSCMMTSPGNPLPVL